MSFVDPSQSPAPSRVDNRANHEKQWRKSSERRPRTVSAQTQERIVRNAALLDEHVRELREALVEQARAGMPAKVRTYIDAKGWKNEELIHKRFAAIYGARAFAACLSCGRCAFVQGGSR